MITRSQCIREGKGEHTSLARDKSLILGCGEEEKRTEAQLGHLGMAV